MITTRGIAQRILGTMSTRTKPTEQDYFTGDDEARSGWGWNYRPGTYRCDRGWNSGTKSYGCRKPGVREVGTEWLCEHHANPSPAPTTPITTKWIANVVWVLYLAALLAGCVISAMWLLLPLFPDTDDGRLIAVTYGTLGGVALFAVLGGLSTLALCWVLNALDTRRQVNRFQFTCPLCLRRNTTHCPGTWCSSCNTINGKPGDRQ